MYVGLKNWPLALPWARGRRGRTQTCRRDRVRPAKGRTPALCSSRLRTRTRSSRMSRAFPAGG